MNKSFCILLFTIFSFSVIHSQEEIIIATDNYVPYTSSQNQGSGVILDIVREAFALEGIAVTYIFAPWGRCEVMVSEGTAFGAVPYFVTPERVRKYLFSDPIIYSYNKFFYNKEVFPNGLNWRTLEDFQGYTMGTILGYWYIPSFERADLTMSHVSTDKQNIAKLIQKRIDFTVIDELTGKNLLQKHFPDNINSIGVLEKPESFLEFHVMISRKYPGIHRYTIHLNNGLKKLKESGKYQSILEKYKIPPNFAIP